MKEILDTTKIIKSQTKILKEPLPLLHSEKT